MFVLILPQSFTPLPCLDSTVTLFNIWTGSASVTQANVKLWEDLYPALRGNGVIKQPRASFPPEHGVIFFFFYCCLAFVSSAGCCAPQLDTAKTTQKHFRNA